MIHGDDYVSIGKHRDLKWMQGELERRFEIKTSMIGPTQGSEKELKVLDRILRFTEEGIEYEPDQRHAEIIAEEMLVSEKSVSTPGEKGKDEVKKALGEEMTTQFRALVARAN